MGVQCAVGAAGQVGTVAAARLSTRAPRTAAGLATSVRGGLPALSVPRTGMRPAGRAERLRVRSSANEDQPPSPGYAIEPSPMTAASVAALEEKTDIQKFLFPDPEELPDDLEMSIWDHFEELRERVIVATVGCSIAIGGSFLFSKDLVKILETPVAREGVRFLALSPGEYFFTTFKVSGYTGLLIGVPLIMYEIIAFVLPGLTQSERKFLGPIVFGSSILFYIGLAFSYTVLAPAALKFFVSYADGAVDSLWSIDQYFEFILVLMLSTGLSFQVPVIQVLLGQLGVVSSEQMLSIWRYVVVGAVIVAAVLTPSTDPFTQTLLAAPLIALYVGGAFVVKALEASKGASAE